MSSNYAFSISTLLSSLKLWKLKHEKLFLVFLLLPSCNLDDSWDDEVEMGGKISFCWLLFPCFHSILWYFGERNTRANFNGKILTRFCCFHVWTPKANLAKTIFPEFFIIKFDFPYFFYAFLRVQNERRLWLSFRRLWIFLFAVVSTRVRFIFTIWTMINKRENEDSKFHVEMLFK